MTALADPVDCLVRHVRRTKIGETATATVLAAQFIPAAGSELDALNQSAGWQSAQVTETLNDETNATITLPNAAGSDGILHRERFALLTDPVYRIGEEWLEVYREPMSPDNLVAVVTPKAWTLSRTSLELACTDLLALYSLARASEGDAWNHAPRDVFDFYTRLPTARLNRTFDGWTGTGTGTTTDGWTYTNASQDPARIIAGPGGSSTIVPGQGVYLDAANNAKLAKTFDPAGDGQAFEVSARITVKRAGGYTLCGLILGFQDGTTAGVTFTPANRGAVMALGNGYTPAGRAAGNYAATMPGDASLRVLARNGWLYCFVGGVLCARTRRKTISPPTSITVTTDPPDDGQAGFNYLQTLQVPVPSQGTILVHRIDFQTLDPFGLRGTDKGDRRLPGVPPPGGLRGRYWNESGSYSAAAGDVPTYQQLVLDPLVDPSDSRLDATIDFTSSSRWEPAAAQGIQWAARWTGSIYLDLAASDRWIKLAGASLARVWIGKTTGAPFLTSTNQAGDANIGGLRSHLGTAKSGWYPIVVELISNGGAGAVRLWDTAGGGGGTIPGPGGSTVVLPEGEWIIVPAARLSQIGCYENLPRGESHRELLTALTNDFGYQWNAEPRTLESGEFPGQVIPRVRAGRDTDKILTSADTVELTSSGDAADAVDRILMDAAGIADRKVSDQMTADLINDTTVAGHLFLSTGADSYPELSEPAQVQTRADSLLALKSGPNEQIAARPIDGSQPLTDTFPLTGALARLRWRPGDGLRLQLEDLGITDRTPRQLVSVQRTYYRHGVSAPVVGWRQRPRGLREFLKRTSRVAFSVARNPPRDVTTILGTLGGTTGAVDSYTRLGLPYSNADLIDAELIVGFVTGSGGIEVNGAATGIAVDRAGTFPVSIARSTSGRQMYARLTGASSYQIQLVARVRS